MTVEEKIADKKDGEEKQNCVLVGVRINKNDGLLLNWALTKVAEPGDHVVAIHVCRDSDPDSKEETSLDGYLEVYKGLCSVKQLDLTGWIARGSSVRKVLVREAKLWAAGTVVVGTSRHCVLRGWVSMAKYCARRLPPMITILAVHNGKIVFKSGSINQTLGVKRYQKPSLYSMQPLSLIKENQLSCVDLKVPAIKNPGPQEVQNSEDGSRDGDDGIKHDNFSFVQEYKEEVVSSSPIYVLMKELPDPMLGWPLLRRKVSYASETLKGEIFSSSNYGCGCGSRKNDNISVVHEYREQDSSSSISALMKELPDSMLSWPLLRRAVSVTPENSKEEVPSRTISVGDDTKYDNDNVVHEYRKEFSSNSISVLMKELPNPILGWPLLRKAVSATPETLEEVSSSSNSGGDDTKSDNVGIDNECAEEVSSSSISVLIKKLRKPPGWPLLRRAILVAPEALKELETREISVVQWVMNLPNRNPPTPEINIDLGSDKRDIPFAREIVDCGNKSNKNCLSAWGTLPKELELLLQTNSFSCRWFSHKELRNATSQFSLENLIGKGGSSCVYKGCLPDGKLVAVKILKLSKEAWRDFILEVDIISSLKHKHIIPLIGVCIDDNVLTLVYEFLSKGSLEENLHGRKEKCVMSWEIRYNVAVRVAEAINYLHEECSRPVIHRDIKSSNILLSEEYDPQLSDFGLALWAPSTSYETHSDVVGTFGYLAPEYFMYGKVSNKIDVYSFGVVLLELLSGRKPISTETPKGQESLVIWAKPILESGDIMAILDPNLVGKFDEVQMRRMILATTLCITRKAKLRPKMSQILKLLQREDEEEWVNSYFSDQESDSEDGDEAYPESSVQSHLGLALLDVDDDTNSFSTSEQNNPWSCSSSFN